MFSLSISLHWWCDAVKKAVGESEFLNVVSFDGSLGVINVQFWLLLLLLHGARINSSESHAVRQELLLTRWPPGVCVHCW